MKKKTNRLIACLLVAVMLIGVLPMSVFAAEPTKIGSLSLGGITAPVAEGSTYITGTAVTGLTGCSVNWYSSYTKWEGSKGDSARASDYKKFSFSNVYTLSLCLDAGSGYEFDSLATTALTNWTLNGITASKVEMRSAKSIVVSFQFPETDAFEGTVIDGLTLGGIDAPVAGESSARNAASITGLEGCALDTVNSVWYIGSARSNMFTTWNTPADFEQGTVYSVCLRIDAGVDAMFDTTATAKANWTLNGISANEVLVYDAFAILLFTFPATEITGAYIENAEVIIPFPTSGGSLTASEFITATIPDDAPYTVSAVTWEPGFSASKEKFTSYSYYTATVTLTPKDMELPFMGLTTLTLNGKNYTSMKVSNGVMTITKSYESRPVPTATFEADGYASGTLSGISAKMKYSLDGGATWTLITEVETSGAKKYINIASGITPANGIMVYLPSVADASYLDSAVQTIEVTRATVTGVTAVQPTAYAGEGQFGSIVGFDADTMEYSKDGGVWTAIAGTELTGLVSGNYYVRVKGNGTQLASETVEFTLAPENPLNKTGEISVSLNENFKMNFYVDLTEEELAKAKVVYTFLGNEYEGTANVSGFSFDGIAPQYIGETLNAKLYIGDFLAYEAECSIKSYLEAVTAKYPTDEALQTLANDILVYGGAAQTYTSYKTGELVSEDVPGTTFVPLDDSYGSYALENNEVFVKFTSATLHFDDVVSLKIKFKKTSEEPFEMVYGGDTVDYVKNGDDYIITVPVMAKFITGSAATFAVDETGGAELTYGVGNYVYAVQSRDDAMGQLAKALWNYGLAAAAYTS